MTSPAQPSRLPSLTLVVCTRNRADDVERLVDSVLAAEPPDVAIVVDSSDDEHQRRTAAQTERLRGHVADVRVIAAMPGLTRQRNVGLAQVTTDVVLFLDDDVTVEADTFRAVRTAMLDGDTIGLTGHDLNRPPRAPRRLHRLIAEDALASGVVTRSGRNSMYEPILGRHRVQWLAGCCMAYRTAAIAGLQFPEELPGYGLGEDVEFSAQAGSRGPLWFTPTVRYRHWVRPTQTGRPGQTDLLVTELDHRHRRVLMTQTRANAAAYWWSFAARSTVEATRLLVHPGRPQLERCKGIVRLGITLAARHRAEPPTSSRPAQP